MTDEERAERGRLAQDLLENPLLQEAIEATDALYWDQWRESPARDSEGRERIHARLVALTDVLKVVKQFAEDGKLAQGVIDRARSGKRSFF